MTGTHETDRLNRFRQAILRGFPHFALIFGAVVLCSCQKPFDVNVKAEDPLKVDVSMDVHVYQHGGTATAVKKPAVPGSDALATEYMKVLERRRNRMAEIQDLKNNRFIGENHEGLLSLRAIPDGDWGKRVRVVVVEENKDREFLIEHEAATSGKSIAQVQKENWLHWQRKSHPGEWIEIRDPDNPDGFVWITKESPRDDG